MKMSWLHLVEHMVPLATQTNHPNMAMSAWKKLRDMARLADQSTPNAARERHAYDLGHRHASAGQCRVSVNAMLGELEEGA